LCRLTAVIPKHKGIDPVVSAMLLSNMMICNSSDRVNTDGSGFALIASNNTASLKSEDPGYEFMTSKGWYSVLDGKDWEGYVEPTTKFMGHVRAATPGIKVTHENSHPFVVGALTAAHNGVIRNKKEFDPDTDSDSEAFFKYLFNNSGKDGLEYDFLKESLEKINGAWCMLINDRRNDDPESLWVVVGKNRELHMIENDDYLLINTSKEGLTLGITFTYNNLRLLGDPATRRLSFDKAPAKLDAEYIYYADTEGLTRIGKAKENDVTVVTTTHWSRSGSYSSPTPNPTTRVGSASNESRNNRKYVKRWCTLVDDMCLTNTETLLMMSRMANRKIESWVDLSDEELDEAESFLAFLVAEGALDEIYAQEVLWTQISKLLYKIHGQDIVPRTKILDFYPDMQFPYWLNSIDRMELIRAELEASLPN
jgi:predicted glutamine amidotransferase